MCTYSVGSSTVAIYGKGTGGARHQNEPYPSAAVNVSADDFVSQANATGHAVSGWQPTVISDDSRNIHVKTARGEQASRKRLLLRMRAVPSFPKPMPRANSTSFVSPG